jgi:hypothetical protein
MKGKNFKETEKGLIQYTTSVVAGRIEKALKQTPHNWPLKRHPNLKPPEYLPKERGSITLF